MIVEKSFDAGLPFLIGRVAATPGGPLLICGLKKQVVQRTAGVSSPLRGEATTIVGKVLQLHGVRVRSANGQTRDLPSGSYFITRVDRAGVVTLREELDIDMPCGEDVSPPPVMPPTYQAPASAFFDARGRPRFEIKYTKGC